MMMMPPGAGAPAPGGMMPPGAPPAGMAQPGPQGPVSSPMTTPQPAEGQKMVAMSQVQMAITILTHALPILKVTSPEGEAVMNALKALSKLFGQRDGGARSLIPSEIMNLVASLPKPAQAQPAPPPGA